MNCFKGLRLASLGLLLFPLPAFAAIIYVNHAATGAANGTSWANAYLTLQTALTNSSAGDQIWVAQGTYKPSVPFGGTTARWNTFNIPEARQIYGGFLGTEGNLTDRNPRAYQTILDGDIGVVFDPNDPNNGWEADNVYHVVNFFGTGAASFTKMSGFIIQNGRADLVGDINDTTDPNASMGGGVLIKDNGGAFDPSAPFLDQLIIRNNFAAREGGGLRYAGKQQAPHLFRAANLRFENNVAQGLTTPGFEGGGGGMSARAHSFGFELQNCVFFNNVATNGVGGGAWGKGTFVNATFSANNCGDPNSGDAWHSGGDGTAPSGWLSNSVVWGNSARPLAGRPNTEFSNIEGGLSNGLNYPTLPWLGWDNLRGNLSTNPLLRDIPGGNLTLIRRSVSIDAGVDAEVLLFQTAILPDATDVDSDGDPNEIIERDHRVTTRIIQLACVPTNDPVDPNTPGGPTTYPAYVDMGAYELCEGDVDGDGTIGLVDLAMLLTHFGLPVCDCTTCAPQACWADIEDCDKDIDAVDLAILLTNYGNSCPQPSSLLGGGEGGGESMMSGTPNPDAALREWLLGSTIDEIMEWFRAGMPPVGGNEY